MPYAHWVELTINILHPDISKKWNVMPIQNWSVALSHLSIIFEPRLKDVLLYFFHSHKYFHSLNKLILV